MPHAISAAWPPTGALVALSTPGRSGMIAAPHRTGKEAAPTRDAGAGISPTRPPALTAPPPASVPGPAGDPAAPPVSGPSRWSLAALPAHLVLSLFYTWPLALELFGGAATPG